MRRIALMECRRVGVLNLVVMEKALEDTKVLELQEHYFYADRNI